MANVITTTTTNIENQVGMKVSKLALFPISSMFSFWYIIDIKLVPEFQT
jgi:hypothetical protein